MARPSKASKASRASRASRQHRNVAKVARSVVSESPLVKLPYHVLQDIFWFVSLSLQANGQQWPLWLKGVALLCKNFAGPALAVLYYCPPLSTPRHLYDFLKTLQHPEEVLLPRETQSPRAGHQMEQIYPYSRWVKELRFDRLQTLVNRQFRIDLNELLAFLPNLSMLNFEVNGDRPESKHSVATASRRGTTSGYQQSFFDTLRKNGTRLRAIKWNYFFNSSEDWPWSSLGQVHAEPLFQFLESVEIVNFNNRFVSNRLKGVYADSLVDALNGTSSLKSLSFTLCLFDDPRSNDVFGALTCAVQHLTLLDTDIKSSMLARYLKPFGHNLRSLTLKHNQDLDLSFTENLALFCPRLERILVDMTFHPDSLLVVNFRPRFDSILPNNTKPQWPRALQHVELNRLRPMNGPIALNFFKSLEDAADSLPNLRVLKISASLDIDRHERIKFRDYWGERLTKIYKRRNPEPIESNRHSRNTRPGRRRSLRNDASSSVILQPTSRTRARDFAFDNLNPPARYIQGMCDTVMIDINNQHPMGEQLQERHFLDEEASGDEDWVG